MRERADAAPPAALPLMPAPHLGVRMSTARMTWTVSLCLLPSALWGVFLFGLPGLGVLIVSVGTAALVELAATLPFRRFTLADGSAVLTGRIVGLLMPAAVPLYVPAAASAFGILVIKQTFGGLGRNWMNPAMGESYSPPSRGPGFFRAGLPRGEARSRMSRSRPGPCARHSPAP